MCFSDNSLRRPPLPRSRGYYPIVSLRCPMVEKTI